jgi:creatinine amidohydrolase
MTWKEVRSLDRPSAVAILPVGAVEAHGPHLPLGTDVIIAEAMARACAQRLESEGVPTLRLPPIWYTSAGFADEFPGTVSVAGETVTALIRQIAASLRRQEIETVAIANAHLDPGHLDALRAAASNPPEGARVVLLDLTRRRVAERLTEEFRTGACHAGRFEGSVVLAERPELVRTDLAGTLTPNPSSLSEAIRDGATSFREAGGADAYFGWPADATAEEGRDTVATLGALLAEAVLEATRGDGSPTS